MEQPEEASRVLAGVVLMLGLAIAVWGDTTSSAQTSDRAAQAASECKSIGGKVNYRNARGQLLAYFYVSQRSCWNYSQITYLSRPAVTAGVTEIGEDSGWTYDGILRKRDFYYTYKGNDYGAHLSSRKGGFTVCQKGGGCYQETPVIKRYAFFDKAGYQISKG
ncbi:hypothetical protein GBA65_09905 [Rubrobacter marinus]|uniref:Uncharacterized protein n=1 Tax=Rubrobacter marinus TaxID=2653852 RepID=A0A6G8PX41_9ACTN|nr:hypothetical protein [Rubrobacter marinus]QIN78782.1 hypothetical protein GBA65_09905 [Rubrobacter marinus]